MENRKAVTGIMLTLLLIGALGLVFDVGLVGAGGTIYIRANDSVDLCARSDSTDLTSSAPIRELSWTLGDPFPVINGRVMFPTLPPSASASMEMGNTHWWAGSIYPESLPTQNARTISMSIMVPSSAPRSDEYYYVLLSAWDSNGSYNQIGFADAWGTWGLAYSWSTWPSGPPYDPTYYYNSSVMALSLGVTYTFYITTQSGVTCFSAYQGPTQIWSQNEPTGGNYLILSNIYSDPLWGDWYDYTDYEEVWQTATPGGSPAFDFYFYNNYWISTSGSSNAATWASYYQWDEPLAYEVSSDVIVVISGDSVLVKNPGERWPMFHHDLWHNGYSTSTAPNTNQILWNYATGGRVWASPAVVDGSVYVGSFDGIVYCLDATTGAQIWNYSAAPGFEIYSSPAVADGKIYIGSCTISNGVGYGTVYCLNASSGAFIWSYLIGTIVESSPATAYGRVYVGCTQGTVYCLDASTGARIWSYQAPAPSQVDSSPAVVDGRVYIGSTSGIIYCLDAFTGGWIWSYQTGAAVISSPAVVGGRVYVGSYDGRVYCLDALTGAQFWNYTTGGVVESSPATAYGKVYVGAYNGRVYCLNASSGAFIWSYRTGSYVVSSPAIADGKVYVGSFDNRVYAFGVHDVAVANVRSSKTVVGQGFSASINVTVANQGGYTETFNVTAYANTTAIQTKTLTLTSGNSTTITFTWNTTGFAKGNYTIKAVADTVPGETDLEDNTYTNGTVTVTIPGDFNGDSTVDGSDFFILLQAWDTTPPSDPRADANCDGTVDGSDFYVLLVNWGNIDS